MCSYKVVKWTRVFNMWSSGVTLKFTLTSLSGPSLPLSLQHSMQGCTCTRCARWHEVGWHGVRHMCLQSLAQEDCPAKPATMDQIHQQIKLDTERDALVHACPNRLGHASSVNIPSRLTPKLVAMHLAHRGTVSCREWHTPAMGDVTVEDHSPRRWV